MLYKPLYNIADGTFILVSQQHTAAELIKLYELTEDFNFCIKLKTIPHHAMIYVGTTKYGSNMCWSARPKGFWQEPLNSSFTRKTTVLGAQYLPMTVNQFELIKAYCYGARGKAYDFGGIAHFACRFLRWVPGVGKILKGKVSDWDWAVFCSESCVEAGDVSGIKLSDLPADKTTPAHIVKFVSQGQYVGNDITIGDWKIFKIWES